MDFNNENVSIYACEFQALVERAKVQIKFPCNYFIEWKANNGKVFASSTNRFQANKSDIIFNQTLKITVNMLFDKINNQYLKKESLLMINLISKSRPDQIKLVGRVAVDLADVLNSKSFQNITTLQLEYCSVEASINFCVKSISVKQSSMHVSELDRSSFNEYMSFQSNLKPQQGIMVRNEGSSTHRDFDDDRSAKGSDKGEIRSLGRDKNKMSSPSLMKTLYTPSSRQMVRVEGSLNQNKISRSNSVKNPLQNPNKMFPPPLSNKIVDAPLGSQCESNFSFNNSKAQEANKSDISRSKLASFQFLHQEQMQKSATNSKARTTQLAENKQLIPMIDSNQKPRDLRINIEKVETSSQNMPKAQKVSAVLSPKQSQQDLLKRIKKDDEDMYQREAVIRKLQSQVQIKRHTMPLQVSFTSSAKDAKTKNVSMELFKTSSQSKRIMALTEALNELETKYTNLTLENEQMRSAWKKEKEFLLTELSMAESTFKFKDREIRQKAKVNEMLQQSLKEVQKCASQRLAEIIYLKSQLTESQKHSNQLIEQKSKLETNLQKVEDQIKFIQSQTSLNQDQLNRTFGDRLAVYQDRITQAENKLSLSEQEKKTLSEKMLVMQKQNVEILEKIKVLQDENRAYLGHIQQSHQELFGLKEQNEAFKKEISKKDKEYKQEKERIWSSKDQQVSYQLKLKNQQIDTITLTLQTKIAQLQEQSRTQLQAVQLQYQNEVNTLKDQANKSHTKVEQLQNTVLTLNDQLASYEQKIHSLNQQLTDKSTQIQDLSQAHKNVDQQKKNMQGEHEQLLLSLNAQIQEQITKVHTLQKQKQQLRLLLQQKDLQLLKCFEQAQTHKHQLKLSQAQSDIFESKLLQQRQFYEHQAESIKLQYSQHIYEIQIQLQQQMEKYQELQHIKQMLKQSLQEWQNKCTDDRIGSSKVVSKLNDIIKEKQQTMYEMENIMRHLEKDQLSIQEHLHQQTTNYHSVLNLYQIKHQQLKSLVLQQQTQCLVLYQTVKAQRKQYSNTIKEKSFTIEQLSSTIQTKDSTITELNSQIHALNDSLHKSETLLIEKNSQTEEKISKLKHQHNQQVDEYEERIRQLQQKILEKDHELLDREMALIQQEKLIQQSKTQMSLKSQEIHQLALKQANIHQQIKQLNQQNDSIIHQKQLILQEKQIMAHEIQSLKVSLQEASQKYSQLQKTLFEYEERQRQAMTKTQRQKQELACQLSLMSDLQQKNLERVNSLQENFKTQLQKVKEEHRVAIQEVLIEQDKKRQAMSETIEVLQDEKIRNGQLLLEKMTMLETVNEEKSQLQQQMSTLKAQRQTQVLMGYKEQIDKYKLQVKSLNEQALQARNQLKQIPTLERTIKIKTIQLNSLKYKSSNSQQTQPLSSEQVSNLHQIIRLKNEEIDSLKKDNDSMKHHELQLYQLETLKDQLYQTIQQYEEEKFHLNSQLNEKDIKITQLKQELALIVNAKTQLKDKIHQLTEKVHHYQTLILDFKGHNEMSSTKSQSDKLNTSRISSAKLVELQTQNSPSQTKIQLDPFLKKIKLLQAQLHKMKLKEQSLNSNEQQHLNQINLLQLKINQLQLIINEKDNEINKKSNEKHSFQPVKPQITYKNPQQVALTFKQIHNLLKKRSEFHNLESTLLKVHEINFKQSIQSQKQDHQTKEKLLTTGAYISLLSKEFHNLKAKIMKLQGKNYQEKAKFISLLRPCQDSIKEVSKLYESTDSSRHSSLQNI